MSDNKRFRVTVAMTVDVEANDETQAEVEALEFFGFQNMNVIEVNEITE